MAVLSREHPAQAGGQSGGELPGADSTGGRERRHRATPRFLRRNVGPTERWLSVAAGGALATWGLMRREVPGGLAMLAGAALLYRGTTGHCECYQVLGVNRARRGGPPVAADRDSDTRQQLGGDDLGIHVDESVVIDRPAAELYRFWRDFENLPRVMRHLESVAIREEGISHWVAAGPAGTSVAWDARVINDVDNRLIGWQSLDGSDVSTAGSVHFDEVPGGTRVRVRLQYNPPGGWLGAAVARLFGDEPGQAIREDLRRWKEMFEGDRR